MKKLLLILMLMPIVTATKNIDGSASEVNYALISNLNIWMYILGFTLIVILIILIIKLWRKRK